MKKEIFALLLLAALFAGGLYNTHYLRCMTGELSETLRLSGAYCENGEYDLALEQANLAAGRWDDSYAYAGIFIRHTEIDAVSYALYDLVAALESTEPESAAELYPGLIAHIESLYEVERVSVASVF